ncbi:MAG: flagellar biosynthesis protein FlhB [Lachnospiraceae bacterium]|nr:flagellar biosynthesis protein FlhB [Lachnospiraceae bacterium]
MRECTEKAQSYTDNELNIVLHYNLQWFAADGEGGEKTEPATDKKLRDARDEGKVAKSKELTAAFDLIVLFLVLKVFMSFVGEKLLGFFSYIYNRMPDFLNEIQKDMSSVTVRNFMNDIILQFLLTCLPFFIFGVVVTILVSIVQVGWKVTTKPMAPKLDKFNPINGFKRIFSKDAIFELIKSVLKIGVILYMAYSSIKSHQNDIFILYELPLKRAVALVGDIIINTGLKISIVYLIVGIVDYIYNKHKFNEDMKMTKQEVKDEFKNTEGDPAIKGQQRKRMQEASQRRMMQDVPKADVVITNPTHFAVAIKYDADTNQAPVVTAKGQDYVAMKIKEIARDNNIRIVENKPLARMLFHNVELGAEIPPELYQSVAEILAMIYKENH